MRVTPRRRRSGCTHTDSTLRCQARSAGVDRARPIRSCLVPAASQSDVRQVLSQTAQAVLQKDGLKSLSQQISQRDQQLGPRYESAPDNIGFRFPGQAGYTTRSDGQTVNGPFPGPAAVFVKQTSASDGDPESTFAAVIASSEQNP